MPLLTSPAGYGLRPVGMVGGGAYNGSSETIAVNVGLGTAVCTGNLLAISAAGVISAVTGAVTGNTASILGVLVGVEYTDAKGDYTIGTYLPTGVFADNNASYKSPKLQVVTDPNVVFETLADHTASQAILSAAGAQLSISAVATISTIAPNRTDIFGTATGLLTGVATGSSKALRVLPTPVDTVEDAIANYASPNWYATVLVRICPSVHVSTALTGI